MKLIHTEYGDRRSWLLIFVRPAFLAYFPAIIWSSCAYGAQMMWLSLMGNTQTLFYASEPYNFTADKVGLTNLAPLSVLFWVCYMVVDLLIGFLYKSKKKLWYPGTRA